MKSKSIFMFMQNIGTDLVGKEKNPSPLFGEAFPSLPVYLFT